MDHLQGVGTLQGGCSLQGRAGADLLSRVERDLRRLLVLKTRKAAAMGELALAEKAVGIAKARQSRKEAVDGVLDAVERAFHEKSIGVLENLLSAFMNDVLPREPDDAEGNVKMPEQSVKMRLESRRNAAALDVSVCSGDQEEDVLRGRGGSVANVLSTGLRLISVARAGQQVRPFLILDEADCWIRPERIKAFSDELLTLSRELGIQILMISHHDARCLSGSLVRLTRNMEEDGHSGVSVDCDQNTSGGDTRNADVFVALRMENFLSHKNTRIPLSDDVTVISGENDLGKSVVVEAFRALAYNDAPDTFIRHKADSARVTLELSTDAGSAEFIQWERVRKGSPKVVYRLLDARGEILRETPSAKEVPEWVAGRLGIVHQQDMDVQVGNQRRPVFLLDETPSKRAAILDMGRESRHLRDLRERWKAQVGQDRQTIRDGEKQIGRLLGMVESLAPAETAFSLMEGLQSELMGLSRYADGIEQSILILDKAASLAARMKRWANPPSLQAARWNPTIIAASLQKMQENEALLRRAQSRTRLTRFWANQTAWPDAMANIHPDRPTAQRLSDLKVAFAGVAQAHRVMARQTLWESSPRIPLESIRLPEGLTRWGAQYQVVSQWLRRGFSASGGPTPEQILALQSVIQQVTASLPVFDARLGRMQSVWKNSRDMMECQTRSRAEALEVTTLQTERAASQAQETRYLEAWGQCPYCGGKASAMHRLTHVSP